MFMSRTAFKRAGTIRFTCALVLAAFFVAGQALHAAAGITHELCQPKASAPKSGHHCAERHHAGQSKHCCCGDPACDCDLKQSTSEPASFPFVSGAGSIISGLVHAGALNQNITYIPDAAEKILGTDFARARAPSQTLFPDTTKLIC